MACVKSELNKVKAENAVLKERIKELENKPTSKNSSMPPSKDVTRFGLTKSTRESSGKKPGGQSNHKGYNLKFSDTPDQIIKYPLNHCQHCNHKFVQSEQRVKDSQQVIDLLPIQTHIVQHVTYQALCPCCQQVSVSEMPITPVKSKVQYGTQIRTFATYLNVRQVISKSRLQEMFRDMFGITISQGTITNIVSESALKMADTYDKIKSYIHNSKVVGADETSCKISGNNHWLWAYQNDLATFLYVHPTRGAAAIASQFSDGLKNSFLVTDRWAAQLKTQTKGKQLCLQHLIRDTQKLIDCYKSKWALNLQKVFKDIIQLTHLQRVATHEKQKIEDRLENLLSSPLSKCNQKIKALQNSIASNRKAITTCLYHRCVPPTNNATEQSVRKVKIKMKIAGCFRSNIGAHAYAVIQSIIDTAIKQNITPLHAICNPSIIFA